MDCFHYERIVNGKRRWLPVDKHWIGRVWIYIENGKPVMHADIDKLIDTNDDKSIDTNYLIASNIEKALKEFSGHSKVDQTFLRRKRKIIENKNKIIDKTIAI